jgi:putative transposase
MEVKRVERIWLTPSDDLDRLCHLSKNLFNEANYIVRQELFASGKWIRYAALANTLKASENYKALPAQTAQQTLKLLDRNWKSFFNAMKVWKAHPELFKARPRPPHYKAKEGVFTLVFTNQQAKLKDGKLILPQKVEELGVKTRVKDGLREVRIIPQGVGYIMELVYNKGITPPKRDKMRVAGIDLGVRNLVTVADNIGSGKPIVVKGGVAKSINQFYAKEKARLRSICDLQGQKTTKRLRKLDDKRKRKLEDYLHKVSRVVVDHCAKQNIGTLVIGHNGDWKQRANIGRRNNQTFVQIPFFSLIEKIQYKAEEAGIKILQVDEGHTSKCSFFDGESVEHKDEYVGKRISRGLFRTAKGRIMNADVNASLNIIRKAVPNAFAKTEVDGIEGAVSHPLRLVIAR